MTVMDDSFDPRFGEAWTASQCAGLLPMPGVWLTLAREGDAVIGFALGPRVAGEAELLLLAVRRAAQGRGDRQVAARPFRRRGRPRGAQPACTSKSAKEIMRLAFTNAQVLLWSVGGANYYSGQRGPDL